MRVVGLDNAEYGGDFYPEFGKIDEVIVLADGSEVPAGPILAEAYADLRA